MDMQQFIIYINKKTRLAARRNASLGRERESKIGITSAIR
jgi:hypothetical protein